MHNESNDDRTYYSGQFARMHERLDEINRSLAQFTAVCAKNHAHDPEVMAMFLGNGKQPLAARLALLENAEPQKEKSSTRIIAWSGLVLSGLLVLVEAIAALFGRGK